jgi:hypothetical protein
VLGSRTPGLDGGQRVEGLQAESQGQLQRLLGLEVLKKRTRPSRWTTVNRTESSLLSTIAEWGPLSRALPPCPAPPASQWQRPSSTSQLSQFHKAESSFVQDLGIKEGLPHPRCSNRTTVVAQHVNLSRPQRQDETCRVCQNDGRRSVVGIR